MKWLETERLILRTPFLDDAADMFEYASDPSIGPNAGWKTHGNIEESRNILQNMINEGNVWAIVLKENNKMIGTLGLHNSTGRFLSKGRAYEIGYALSGIYHGRGLMPEAVKRVVKYLFEEMSVDVVSVAHYDFNNKSKRVIEKVGFVYEGRIRKSHERVDGSGDADMLVYSLLKEEYFDKKSKGIL